MELKCMVIFMSLEANLLTVGDLLYTKPKCRRDFQQKGAEGECRCANSGGGGGAALYSSNSIHATLTSEKLRN